MPLIDSGISLYVWSNRRFFSVIVYSCKSFATADAVSYTRDFFGASDNLQHEVF